MTPRRQRPIWTLSPTGRLITTVCFVAIVVMIPTSMWWLWAVAAAGLAAVAWRAQVPLRRFRRGLQLETPFLLLAIALPFLASGPRLQLGFVSLSAAGLTTAGAIAAKATLGMAAAVTLRSTTNAAELLTAAHRLKVPPVMVEIAGFMVRYGEILADEWARMRRARLARGFAKSTLSRPARLRVWGVALAALFLRAYARGERVQHAMVSRGYRQPGA